MKFQPDTSDGVNLITRHDPGAVWVVGQAHRGGVVIPWVGSIEDWHAAEAADLGHDHFARLLRHHPELVIYGSGARLRFPAASLLHALIDAGVGVETMDTAAACRTYNVLAAEGRRVVAALLPSA